MVYTNSEPPILTINYQLPTINSRVEVEIPATPATRLNLNHLTRNITRNTGATTRNK